MTLVRYSINVTLDGCCHHEAGLLPDAELMHFWTGRIQEADSLLYGRVTYQMMESAWRRPESGTWPEWMSRDDIPFAEAINRARKYVVSGTLGAVEWNAHLLRGELAGAVARLKRDRAGVVALGGVTLPVALAGLGLINEYEFVVHPVVAGYGPTLLAGVRERLGLELLDRREFASGVVAKRYRSATLGGVDDGGQ